MSRISSTRLLFMSAVSMVVSASYADASQGPGIAPGTASASLQWMMAIVVYGLCAAAIAAGALGVFRKN